MTTSRTTGSGAGLVNTLGMITALIFCVAAVGFAGFVVGTLAAHDTCPAEEHHPVKSWRPDISKCPEDVELWDCIRHAMYRSDL